MKKLLLVLIVVFLLIAPGIAQAHSDKKCEKSDASCTFSQEDDRHEHNQDRDSDDDDDRDHDDDDDDRGGRDRDKDDDDDDRDGRDHDKDDRDHDDDDDDDDRDDRHRDKDDDDDDRDDRDRDDDDDEDRDRDDDNDDDDDDGEDRDRDDDDDGDSEDRDHDDDEDDDGEDRDHDKDDDDDGEDRDRDDDDDDGEDRDHDKDDDDDDGEDRDRDDDDDDDDGDEPDDDEGDDDDGDEPDDDDDGDDDGGKKNGCRTIADGGIYLRKEPDGFGDEIIMGFDAWGYNYQAYKFQGFAANTGRGIPPALEGNVYLKMKWNDTYLSNRDCDGDHHLDQHYGHESFYGTNAWITNLYKWSYIGDDGEVHWVHWFLKATAKPTESFDCTSIGATIFNSHFCWVKNDYRDPYGGSQGMTALMNGLGFGGR